MLGAAYNFAALSPRQEGATVISEKHLGRTQVHRVSLFGLYGLHPRLNALITLPFKHWRQEADELDVHHSRKSVLGLRDLQVGLRWVLSNAQFGPGQRLFIGANLALPTAPTYEFNPFGGAADSIDHHHFVLGTGTTTVTFYGEWWYRSEFPWVTGLVARFRPRLFTSRKGFQPGSRLEVDFHAIGHSYRLWRAFPYLTLNFRREIEDYWDGSPAPNSGGLFIEASAGLDFELTESVSAVFRFRGPIWTKVEGGQQISRGLELALRTIR